LPVETPPPPGRRLGLTVELGCEELELSESLPELEPLPEAELEDRVAAPCRKKRGCQIF
jgi:hypothetical protein